jgi:multimeric flavodoxin WrbA
VFQVTLLGVVCSPRKNGNTEILVKEALDSARVFGAKSEIIKISDLNITPCDGCESCEVTGECKIEDDMQVVFTKLEQCDGIILGSPVYFWGVTAQAKAVMDRTFLFRRDRRLRNKVGGAVVVARDSGASATFRALSDFFNLHRMIPARSIGPRTVEELAQEWGGGVIAYADKPGDVKKDEKALANAQSLGKAMVETIQAIKRV